MKRKGNVEASKTEISKRGQKSASVLISQDWSICGITVAVKERRYQVALVENRFSGKVREIQIKANLDDVQGKM